MTEITDVPTSAGDDLKDFSEPRKRVAFTIDGDVFEAPPVIPAMVLMEYAKKFSSVGEDDDVENHMGAMVSVLQLILRPASYALFMERLSSQEKPISLGQLQNVIEFLMGEYGMRPIQPSSSSPAGSPSPASGTNSTENTQAVVSTSLDSPPLSS